MRVSRKKIRKLIEGFYSNSRARGIALVLVFVLFIISIRIPFTIADDEMRQSTVVSFEMLGESVANQYLPLGASEDNISFPTTLTATLETKIEKEKEEELLEKLPEELPLEVLPPEEIPPEELPLEELPTEELPEGELPEGEVPVDGVIEGEADSEVLEPADGVEPGEAGAEP